jgi:hypothetical protein
MIFAKQYLVSNADAAWDKYCTQHPEGNHTWAAMKDFLYSQVAPAKHHTNAAFQKLHSAKQGPDQTITSFSAYIVTTCKGTDITDYVKRMFFWTGLHPEIRCALHKGEDYLTFEACLEVGVEAEWHSASMQNTTRLPSPRPKNRRRRRPEMIRARVRPITILVNAPDSRVYHSTHMMVFTAKAMAVAVAAMAKAASNISKATEAARKAPECPGNPMHASPAESLAIRPRTAKRTLQGVLPPLHRNTSCQ